MLFHEDVHVYHQPEEVHIVNHEPIYVHHDGPPPSPPMAGKAPVVVKVPPGPVHVPAKQYKTTTCGTVCATILVAVLLIVIVVAIVSGNWHSDSYDTPTTTVVRRGRYGSVYGTPLVQKTRTEHHHILPTKRTYIHNQPVIHTYGNSGS